MGSEQHVIICGAGIIGVATAYELSKKGIACTVVECGEVAGQATGRSGGFLAKKWSDLTTMKDLARKGFDMHLSLAAELGGEGRYAFRHCDAFKVVPKDEECEKDERPAWLGADAGGVAAGHAVVRTGSQEDCAQLDPALFTRALLETAVAAGARLRNGHVQGVTTAAADGKVAVTGVIVDGENVPASHVVLAMGPWTGQAAAWLTAVPAELSGEKSHSVVLSLKEALPAEALFVDYEVEGEEQSSEIYPRPDGTVFVCGMDEPAAPLPASPRDVAPTEGSPACILRHVQPIASALAAGDVAREQAAFLPTTPDGPPVIGAVQREAGAYVAAGHGFWGILTGPPTGAAIADLIATGHTDVVDVAPFRPERFAERGEVAEL